MKPIKNKVIFLLFILLLCSCGNNAKQEKFQSKRTNIINVRDRVKEIQISEDDVIIGAIVRIHLIDDYMIIRDDKSYDKLIHIFDKNNFRYITSIAQKGQGPDEITNMGHIGIDEANREFFVSDHGKQKIFSYELDSVLVNPFYSPKTKMTMNAKIFPSEYHYINDTLSIGRIIEPTGTNGFQPSVGKWNMRTGEITVMPYKHPKIKKKRMTFAVSLKDSIYVECYSNHDLISIFDLEGNLKYNIYGKDWGSTNMSFYRSPSIFKNKIVVANYGGSHYAEDIYPTRLIVFDTEGNYIKTLEMGMKIGDYCYDENNNRIILNLNDADMQFAYLELDGLLDE